MPEDDDTNYTVVGLGVIESSDRFHFQKMSGNSG